MCTSIKYIVVLEYHYARLHGSWIAVIVVTILKAFLILPTTMGSCSVVTNIWNVKLFKALTNLMLFSQQKHNIALIYRHIYAAFKMFKKLASRRHLPTREYRCRAVVSVRALSSMQIRTFTFEYWKSWIINWNFLLILLIKIYMILN